MSRKILKVLISLLFLAVAAVAALFAIKNFFPELTTEQPKYGVKNVGVDSTKKTPAFKKDEQEQKPRITPNYREGKKYGVAPVEIPPYREDMTDKYGVAPVEMPPIMESKYGVAPVRPIDVGRTKYGIAPISGRYIRPDSIESMKGKYGVSPIEDDELGE